MLMVRAKLRSKLGPILVFTRLTSRPKSRHRCDCLLKKMYQKENLH